MTGYQQVNSATIRKAFNRFVENKDKIIETGLVQLAKSALDFLVSDHDYGMAHTLEDNTLAYAVAHDGWIIASGYHEGGDGIMGRAREMAEDLASEVEGWCAIILSEMEGYYRVDYENDMLNDTIIDTRDKFNTYFKKIR